MGYMRHYNNQVYAGYLSEPTELDSYNQEADANDQDPEDEENWKNIRPIAFDLAERLSASLHRSATLLTSKDTPESASAPLLSC
jgi:hypothetical protein